MEDDVAEVIVPIERHLLLKIAEAECDSSENIDISDSLETALSVASQGKIRKEDER